MFDEVYGMAALSRENFCEGVRDTFGASIVSDVLDPILKEIDSLQIFNVNFQQQLFNIDSNLSNARALQFRIM